MGRPGSDFGCRVGLVSFAISLRLGLYLWRTALVVICWTGDCCLSSLPNGRMGMGIRRKRSRERQSSTRLPGRGVQVSLSVGTSGLSVPGRHPKRGRGGNWQGKMTGIVPTPQGPARDGRYQDAVIHTSVRRNPSRRGYLIFHPSFAGNSIDPEVPP